MFYSFSRSTYLLTSVVAIALVATPAMISFPSPNIAHAQTNSPDHASELVASGLRSMQGDPNNPEGYWDLVRGLAAQGQLANTFTFLETNLGRPLTPESALKLIRNAEGYREVDISIFDDRHRASSSHREDIISLYRQMVSRYPDHGNAWRELIERLRDEGRWEEVVAIFQEQVRINPPEFRPTWGLAMALVENDQIQEAISAYDQMLPEHRNHPDFYVEFGALLEKNQEFDRALRVYLAGIQAFPRDRPSDSACVSHVYHGKVRWTSYDRLIQLLANQDRLGQILPIVEQSFPNTSAETYRSLALSLAYYPPYCRPHPRLPYNPPARPYRELAEAVNQRLRERYPEAESWQGRAETWKAGSGYEYY